jgi:hypothetical protein
LRGFLGEPIVAFCVAIKPLGQSIRTDKTRLAVNGSGSPATFGHLGAKLGDCGGSGGGHVAETFCRS